MEELYYFTVTLFHVIDTMLKMVISSLVLGEHEG